MKNSSKSVIHLILLFFVCQIGTGAFSSLAYLWSGSFVLGLYIGIILFNVPFLYILYKKTNVSIVSRVPDEGNTGFPLLKLLCIGVGLALVNFLFAHFLNPNPVGQGDDTSTITETIAFVLETTLMASVVEEMFYRKWMISYLERSKVKPALILFVTSFLFFLAHTNWGNMSFRFDTFIFGMVQYYIYTKHRDVRCCIFVHSINNLLMTSIGLASKCL